MSNNGITCKACGDVNQQDVDYYSRCRKCQDWFCEVHVNKCINCSEDRKYCQECLASTTEKCKLCNNKVKMD